MKSRLNSIYYWVALTLIGVMLVSVLWEFFLEHRLVSYIFGAHEPESMHMKWEYVISSVLFAAIAMIIPISLALNRMRDADHAREALTTAYDDLEKRVQNRTHELANTNEQLKSEVAERLQHEEALRKSEKELRLLASQLLTAQESERRTIALDLHDHVSQRLIALKWRIEHALVECDDGKKATAELTKRLVPVMQESIEEVRNMYMRLRPSILDDLGLTATLTWLRRDFQAAYPDIHIQTEIDIADSDIPDNLKGVIYRVVQEGLNNVARHSKADQVRVTLTREDDIVELTVQDNGIGFLMVEVLSVDDSLRGMGLSAMRERIQLAGGALRIGSEKGEGTQVRASWPIKHDCSPVNIQRKAS